LGAGERRATLTLDDQTGIRTLYDQLVPLATSAVDVGIGTNGTTENVWLVGTTAAPSGGNRIYKWNGNKSSPGFQVDSANRGAVRITVQQDGIPWIVDSAGNIYRRSSADPTTGTWSQKPLCAKDIAAYDAVNIWMIGCDSNATIAGHIYKWIANDWQ